MLQLNNQSRFAPVVQVLPDRDAIDTLYIVVRGTFTLAPRARALRAAAAAEPADVYWGEPGASSLKYAADIHVGKVGTDVALVGSAHAPRGPRGGGDAVRGQRRGTAQGGARGRQSDLARGRRRRDVAGAVREHAADLRARVRRPRSRGWAGRRAGEWRHRRRGAQPSRRGLPGGATPAVGRGRQAPNLEDPQRPWLTLGDRPPPTGFGFIAPSWQPRRGHAGTYDDAWAATRAPFLPRDFDPRFANAASAGLTFDQGLRGGEPIALDGVSREGPLRSAVPAIRPRVEVIAAGKREAPPVQLETLLLEPDERRMSLTWRAALLATSAR